MLPVCSAHLLDWSFLRVLWCPEQSQLGFLPHFIIVEFVHAHNRLEETNN